AVYLVAADVQAVDRLLTRGQGGPPAAEPGQLRDGLVSRPPRPAGRSRVEPVYRLRRATEARPFYLGAWGPHAFRVADVTNADTKAPLGTWRSSAPSSRSAGRCAPGRARQRHPGPLTSGGPAAWWVSSPSPGRSSGWPTGPPGNCSCSPSATPRRRRRGRSTATPWRGSP